MERRRGGNKGMHLARTGAAPERHVLRVARFYVQAEMHLLLYVRRGAGYAYASVTTARCNFIRSFDKADPRLHITLE